MSLRPHAPLIFAIAIVMATIAMIIRFAVPLLMGIRALQADKSIQLPVRKTEMAIDPATMLIVTMKADGVVYVGDQPLADTAIDDLLQARAPKTIMLRADSRLRYDRVKRVMQLLGARGAKITFSVVEGTPATASPTTPAAVGPSSRAESK